MSEASWKCFYGLPQAAVPMDRTDAIPALVADGQARYTGAIQRYKRANVAHPLGIETGLTAPPKRPVTQEEFRSRTLANAMSLSWMSVQPTTLGTYSNGWRQWTQWSSEFGTDPWMRVKPACFTEGGTAIFPMLLTFYEVCVLSFLAWLSIDRELKPNTCSGYLSAVRFMLNRSNIDTSFMETNTHIKATKTGMWIAYRCTHPEADEKTQPFTLDLIMIAWTRYLDVKNNEEDYVMVIAMLLAYVCLMRKSEYLDEPATDHHLLAESVWFEVEHPVGSGQVIQVPSTDCHLYDRRGMRDVTIDIWSAKNDEGGQGHRFTCTRVDLATSTRPFDLSQEL